MKKVTVFSVLMASSILALAPGCKSEKIGQAEVLTQKLLIGTWQGVDTNGDIYTFRFTKKDWEARVERYGAIRPYYRGKYTLRDADLEIQITEERDPSTNNWMKDRGYLPSNIVGKFSGGALKVTSLTQAELMKKR